MKFKRKFISVYEGGGSLQNANILLICLCFEYWIHFFLNTATTFKYLLFVNAQPILSSNIYKINGVISISLRKHFQWNLIYFNYSSKIEIMPFKLSILPKFLHFIVKIFNNAKM